MVEALFKRLRSSRGEGIQEELGVFAIVRPDAHRLRQRRPSLPTMLLQSSSGRLKAVWRARAALPGSFRHLVNSFENALDQSGDNLRMVPVKIIAHRPERPR